MKQNQNPSILNIVVLGANGGIGNQVVLAGVECRA